MIPENPPWTVADRFSSHHMLPLPHLREAEISFQGKVSPCIKELLKRMKDLAPPSPTSPSFFLCYWMLENYQGKDIDHSCPKAWTRDHFPHSLESLTPHNTATKLGLLLVLPSFSPALNACPANPVYRKSSPRNWTAHGFATSGWQRAHSPFISEGPDPKGWPWPPRLPESLSSKSGPLCAHRNNINHPS